MLGGAAQEMHGWLTGRNVPYQKGVIDWCKEHDIQFQE